jgi:hypothetical protein
MVTDAFAENTRQFPDPFPDLETIKDLLLLHFR